MDAVVVEPVAAELIHQLAEPEHTEGDHHHQDCCHGGHRTVARTGPPGVAQGRRHMQLAPVCVRTGTSRLPEASKSHEVGVSSYQPSLNRTQIDQDDTDVTTTVSTRRGEHDHGHA